MASIILSSSDLRPPEPQAIRSPVSGALGVAGKERDYPIDIPEILYKVMEKTTDLIPIELTIRHMSNVIPRKSDFFKGQSYYTLKWVFELLLIQCLTVLAHKLT